MATKERTQEIVKGLYDAVLKMDEDGARALSQTALDEDVDPYYALTQGLTAAMEKVGQLYTDHVYFVPELLLCSDALYAGLDVLKPHIKASESEKTKCIIIGTVEGDIHDIGKNLVRIMFEAAGWTVHDLGKDVMLRRFADEQVSIGADIIALSALMTTSMLAMPRAIELIRAKDSHVPIMVGGAPLTRDVASRYGADGYAQNAGEAVHEAKEILKRLGR
jgi:methanogenic corrinoid protein MtbC1